MTVAFVRQMGAEPGVQLNPLRDNSEIPSTDNSDQIFGIVMRATRGRIDKPFAVDSGNVYTKLGYGEQIRVNALNLAWVHVVEALNNGAYQAVVQRLSTAESKIKWAVVKKVAALADSAEVGTAHVGSAKVGATPAEEPVETADAPVYTFEVSEEEPEGEFLFAVKHLECFNDGIKVSFRAEEKREGGKNVANDEITLQIIDPHEDNVIYTFTGSLDINAKDDYGNSKYLPDIVEAQTDAVEVRVGVSGAAAVVEPDSEAYGYTENGSMAWAESDTLICFEEGATNYETEDYLKACNLLQNSEFDYAYISSGGTEATALLQQLAQLAYETNRQLRFDIPGTLTPEGAIQWVENLNFGSQKCAHLLHAFWAPLKSDDPTGVNPKGVFGVATLNIAMACGRNATKNAKGFAAKNYPIAGREWPVNRSGISQIYTPSQKEKSQLATAKINPTIYEQYTGGGRYTFTDSLTCAMVDQSLRKLIAVADMSTSIDDAVTRAGKDYLQLPMKVAVKRMQDFLLQHLTNAEASGWLVASNDPMMEGRSFKYQVQPNAAKPYDAMDVMYWVRYDGTARQIFVTQTLTK